MKQEQKLETKEDAIDLVKSVFQSMGGKVRPPRRPGNIDKYEIRIGDIENSEKGNLVTRKETNVDIRFTFGFGTRIYLSKRLSLWLEKRWIKGEKFGVDRSVVQGSFYNDDQQKTLYSPINSLGTAFAFAAPSSASPSSAPESS